MSPTDVNDLLRELRPPAEARPDHDALERLLLAGPEAPVRTRHRYAGPVAIAGTLAVVATAGIAFVPSGGDRVVPGILDRAAAAVTKPDTILHYRSRITIGSKVRTIESWQTTDGRRERSIFDGGALESVQDATARTFTTFHRERNEVVDHTDPAFFAGSDRPRGLADSPVPFGFTVIGDLSKLLARAKSGEDGVSVLQPTEIDGVAVEHVRITGSVRRITDALPGTDPAQLTGPSMKTTRDVYLRTEDALPVRVVDDLPLGGPGRTVDFLLAEQLPLDAGTEGLLRMGEHPGATRVDEGPFD